DAVLVHEATVLFPVPGRYQQGDGPAITSVRRQGGQVGSHLLAEAALGVEEDEEDAPALPVRQTRGLPGQVRQFKSWSGRARGEPVRSARCGPGAQLGNLVFESFQA